MISRFYFKNKKSKSPKRITGFSLPELIVVMTIITIILTALVIRQKTFQERFRIDDKVYDLVLYFRKAQSYTLGVKEFTCSTNSTKSFPSYGVFFKTTNASDRDRFHFFVDQNNNGLYGSPESDSGSCYTETTIIGTPGIDRICGYNSSAVRLCWPNDASGPNQIAVTFKRPDPRPTVNFLSASGTILPLVPPVEVYFKYPTQSGETKVIMEATGQVSVSYVP
ncbi:MAG: prepilin-type N-terminal cleavage/methylation domain-containing protein [Patescibacteria group bacterium]